MMKFKIEHKTKVMGMRIYVQIQNALIVSLFLVLLGFTPDVLKAVQGQTTAQDQRVTLSVLTQNEFRDAIWRERWYELCFEGKIWFDMVRLRKAFNVTTNEFEDYVGHTFVYGPTLSERELLFPLPTSEVRNNENLNQNPGY